MASRPSFTPQEQFEEYRIVRLLGSGAMGQVYLAHDTLLDRLVAIKFIANLDLPLGAASELRERFFIEARAIARLSHPNVVTVYRIGEWQQHPYLVSEFVRGKSLDRIERPMPWQRVHRIGVALARGLAAAHRRGVLHRDIKPANVMLTPSDELKLLDFGLAKLVDITQIMSGPNAVLGAATLQEALPLQVPPLEAPAAAHEESRPDHGPSDPPSINGFSSKELDSNPTVRELREKSLALDATIAAGHKSHSKGPQSSELTQLGDVVGSPLYMAPEIWRGEPATRQADIYSLGTLLYELCAGYAPNDGLSLSELPLRVQDRDARPLAEAAPTADPRFCAIVDRCLRRQPSARYESGDALRAALEQLTGSASAFSLPKGNPYRGLANFEVEHHSLFFGRTAEVSAIIDRLRAEPLVLIAGNSGVGKSSLCKAGVLAELTAGALGPLRIASWVPGRRPLQALASALAPVLDRDERMLQNDLAKDPQQVGRALCQKPHPSHPPEHPSSDPLAKPHAAGTDPPRRVLLFVDQLEELLTQSDPAEAALASEALAALIPYSPYVRILGTVRGDFLSKLIGLPGLGAEVARGLHLIGPLSADGLREAITQPALALGYAFESAALIESLVTAAGQSDGGLPLLQFTLAALWETRDPERRIIPASALSALGGVGGALARHADQVYERLSPRQQVAARRILGQVITVEGTRTCKHREELFGATADREDTALALEALVAGRILSVRSDESGRSVYELSHEALLVSWSTLRIFLAEDAQLRGLRQRLSQAASDWERLGRGRELLWRERRLEEIQLLSSMGLEATLPPRELAFLRASRKALRLRRILWLALLGTAPLLVALFYVGASLRAQKALHDKVIEHTSQVELELKKAHALRERVLALREAAFRSFDAREPKEGELQWEQVVSLEAELQKIYSLANRTAEAACLLDTKSKEPRRLVATLLFESALLAERGGQVPQHDDLYQRLLIYDSDGSFERVWAEPATLKLDSEPRGATVTLTPIDGGHRLAQDRQRRLGRTPLSGVRLGPGGYLLTLAAPGRVEVKYPLYLKRGESLPLTIALPTIEQVPPGFVYIPAGRFLFGSRADEEERRGFLTHVPLHEVFTSAYLIARHETTYGEWLSFLRALPPPERARYLPSASQEGIVGWLRLRELADGTFELTTQPTERAYRVREGEPIVYPGRRLRREQDWLRMPVTGISSADALAYLGWLRSSGRLPGARLCSEKEWERAARGADSRVFPHGDRLEPDDANHDRTYDREPLGMGLDEVGAHPASRSLFGVDDLLGNAFEWVGNDVSKTAYAVRGGAYYYSARTGRLDNRQESEPSMRNPTAGMRVCATMPLSDRNDK